MPIFARRRLQRMLNDIGTFASEEKQRDLIRRIESKRKDQALSGEAELAVLWAISRIGDIEPEPVWWGSSAPELLTDHLVRGRAAVIEVKGVSDGAMGEDSMRLAAEKLAQTANQIRRKAGQHLHFSFLEESGYGPDGYLRRRKVSESFNVSEPLKARLAQWIEAGEVRDDKLRLHDESIDVVISWRQRAMREVSVFCTMPPEAYSLTKNPIAYALREARGQLRNPAFDGARIIILFDAGCSLLRNLQSYDASGRRFSGEQIIREFLRNTRPENGGGIEVAILSAHRDYSGRAMCWKLTVYDPSGQRLDSHPLQDVVKLLPPPRLEGYQARSLQRQGRFSLSAQQYGSGTAYHWNRSRTMVKVSTRALLEFLSGRIDEEVFRMTTGLKKDGNIFISSLKNKKVISRVTFESGGIDRDDDYLVLEFDSDPSVEPLKATVPNSAPE